MFPGVSVIICCHNSATRLPVTLEHLLAQEGTVPWEVIVVDNGCSDDTVDVARRSWTRADVPLKIVREDTLGLSAARRAGIEVSSGEFFSFVDDDNWVAPNWIVTAYETLRARPRVAAVGSFNEPAFEGEKPEWIEPFLWSLATGEQLGDGRTRPALFGAGLTLRREAWDQLVASGFRSLLTDRTGTSLASGGDNELCYALARAGWEMHYEPALRLKHFMPRGRLTWGYMRRLHRSFGASSVHLEVYAKRTKLQRAWSYRFAQTLATLVRRGPAAVPSLVLQRAGDPNVIFIEGTLGRLAELVKTFGTEEPNALPASTQRRS